MSKYILVLNCGSSSAKFNLFSLAQENKLEPVLQGMAEEIGNTAESSLKWSTNGNKQRSARPIADHRQALLGIFDMMTEQGFDHDDICAVGHRVVHGGEAYTGSVRINDEVIEEIRRLIPIAPLHNPPNLTGIEESIRLLPDVPQVAVFDTAFHGTLPDYAYRYAVPAWWYEDLGVRKFGFHGTSHMYVARRAARMLGKKSSEFCGITAHLGNGCSITKIENGKSVDTSMGFTPLEGVIMGTRSGDIDPALISHVANSLSVDQGLDKGDAYEAVMKALNKESGLKALADTNMMQVIRERAQAGDVEALAAIRIYAYRVAKYIGQYWATLPHTDAIVFTAGLGENEGYVRRMILEYLPALKFEIDEDKNSTRGNEMIFARSRISAENSLAVMVIPTDEEAVIGYDTLYLGYLGEDIPDMYPFEMQFRLREVKFK
jgi:acetate kinase